MKHFLKKHKEKINYFIVGMWNTIFGYFVFAALYYLLNKNIHYLFLLIISNILSITNAYIGYKTFVFKTKGNYLNEYLRFYLVYGAMLILNLIFLPVLVEIFRVNPVIAQGMFVFVSFIGSYIGHKYFSFRSTL
jgi:putative flippase GtrA